MAAERQLLVKFILKSTVGSSIRDRSGIRDICRMCCSKGWVDESMITEAIACFEKEMALGNHLSNESLKLLLETFTDWFRSDVQLWVM